MRLQYSISFVCYLTLCALLVGDAMCTKPSHKHKKHSSKKERQHFVRKLSQLLPSHTAAKLRQDAALTGFSFLTIEEHENGKKGNFRSLKLHEPEEISLSPPQDVPPLKAKTNQNFMPSSNDELDETETALQLTKNQIEALSSNTADVLRTLSEGVGKTKEKPSGESSQMTRTEFEILENETKERIKKLEDLQKSLMAQAKELLDKRQKLYEEAVTPYTPMPVDEQSEEKETTD